MSKRKYLKIYELNTKMYIADLFFLFICPFAFSLINIIILDLYEIYILRTKLYTSKNIKINQLYNKGLFIGIAFGFWRFMLGEPVIPYYLNK